MMDNLNYYWRIAATGTCFSCFGIGGLIMAITIFPVIHWLPMTQEKKHIAVQRVLSRSFKMFVWLMQFVGVLRVTLVDADKLNKPGCFVVANHPTLIDVVIIISVMEQADCIVKQALWHNPFLRGVVKGAGYIPNTDPQQLMSDCANALQQGRSLIIFPEGTRTVPGQKMKMQRGAANIALQSQHDLTPVRIECAPPSLTKDKRWYQIPKQGRVNMRLTIGDVIKITPFLQAQEHRAIASRKLTHYMQDYFQKAVVHE